MPLDGYEAPVLLRAAELRAHHRTAAREVGAGTAGPEVREAAARSHGGRCERERRHREETDRAHAPRVLIARTIPGSSRGR